MTGRKVFLTPSGTHALELAFMALALESGSEVILPSFTFSSTANALLMAGLKPVFVDIRSDTLNLDETLVEKRVTSRTKAILPVHYAGVGCEMNPILEIANRHGLKIVEDAAQGIDACYDGKPLGTIGNLGAYSFHQTKNVTCGEGGALIVSDQALVKTVEIHREKGTNRTAFLNNEIDKYTWIDVGSSYLLADPLAAILLAQFEEVRQVTGARKRVFETYRTRLDVLREYHVRLPEIPATCRSNYHNFYLILRSNVERDRLLGHLRERGIGATFHFVPLHDSPAARKFGLESGPLPVTEEMSGRILRLPIYPNLGSDEQERVIGSVLNFFKE